jgi:hypothetical protein
LLIYFLIYIYVSSEKEKEAEKKKTENLPGSTRIYAKVEKANQLFEEKLLDKDWQQICKVQKTCRQTKHLHSLSK